MRSPSHTHHRAKALRRSLTPPEVFLWARLRGSRADGSSFRRQHPIGPFIADFCCEPAKLVIEVDGQGHDDEAQAVHDRGRDPYLARRGYEVMRIAALEVLRDPDEAAQAIIQSAITRLRG